MVEWKSLGEICEIKGRIGFRGYTRDDQVDKGEGAISLSPGNINEGVVNYDSCTYITWNKYEESPEIMVSEGDIILCKTASVGKVARIYSLPERATINPQLVLIKNIKTDPQFLLYVLSDSPFQSKIKGLAGVGSVPNVSQVKLASIQIPIPSLSEQQRIVGILDMFTSSIENLKEQIAQRRKQYEYYRDQLLDLEGKEGVEMKTLGDVCEIKGRIGFRGYTRKDQVQKGEGAISLSPGNIVNGIINYESCTYINWAKYEESPEIMTYNGDIILCKTASVGKVAMITNLPEKATINPQLVVLKNIKVNNKFLYFLLSNHKYQSILVSLAGIGSVPNISQAKLNEMTISVPPLSEQQRIVSILDTFEASVANLEQQLAQREKQYEYYRNKLLTFV